MNYLRLLYYIFARACAVLRFNRGMTGVATLFKRSAVYILSWAAAEFEYISGIFVWPERDRLLSSAGRSV